ncbi:MAG: hypothetical protein LKK50_05170 [Prevotella sp.]|jgi:hypothetical protein|nr:MULTISPECIES: hypothetical protein [unclassified Prevotella]MCH4251251.1 hypothetical protein [Prevotella sp.]MCI1290757.1 hypothetical protein [Prevotella sp.]MCI1370759.1 hypothetical protein [Prevotella sp.]MCI1449724.1 hypothetical protein [Prevotella sp.]MCI1685593.1 hypothetical protein [Prevotella sp.]
MSIMLVSTVGMAQETTFKPGGQPVLKVFTDFRVQSTDGKTNTAFELSRVYLGYAYYFSPYFSTKVVLDVTDKNNGYQGSAYTVYAKNAYGEYSRDGLTLDFGLIGTNTFNWQESLWGKRYLLKSFQDLNGFASSADLGLGIKYQIAPEVSMDVQVVNGEGYKSVQADSAVKVSAGLTYQPVRNFYMRIYGDYLKKKEAQITFNAMLAYQCDRFTVGGEYNRQTGHNKVKDHNLNGLSFWGTCHLNRIMTVFGRYDYLSSKKLNGSDEGWNSAQDGNLYVAGMEFFPVKGVSISPNVQIQDPKLSGSKPTTCFLLSFQYKL